MARCVWRPRVASRSGPELLGRQSELAQLEDELTRAGAGDLRIVLVLGDPGVGKSRLGQELLARHGESGGLFARAHQLGARAAFGLWIEAVAPALETLSDEELIEACGGLLDDLASLFTRVASVRGAVPDRAISAFGTATLNGSTDLTRRFPAGAARIPTSSCG